jgi:solute carrier family 25 iron transporter 28/37
MSADFLCGALAGAAADTCLFPLDVVRARTVVRPGLRGPLAEAAILLRAEGMRAFYKGLPAHLLASIPGNGIFYATYEASKASLAPHLASTTATHALSGAAACLASLAIYTPMEVVKQRTMVQSGKSSAAVLRSVLAEGGPALLYRGVGAGALTWVPYFSLYFVTYEALTRRAGVAEGAEPSFGTSLACGLQAGLLAAALTTPADVVKTQLQVGSTGIAQAAAPRTSAWAIARRIAATEGVAGFFRGLLPRAMMLAPASSLTIALYARLRDAAAQAGVLQPRPPDGPGQT